MPPVLRPWVATATKLRLGFAIVALLYAALTGTFAVTLPWVLAIVGFELAAETMGGGEDNRWRVGVLPLLLAAGALTTGVAYYVAGPAVAPLALIPAHHAGVQQRHRGWAGATALTALGYLLSAVVNGQRSGAAHDWKDFALWLVATAAFGALGSVSAKAAGESEGPDAWSEARYLLGRLGHLAETGTGGFDAPSIASECLADVAAAVPHERSGAFARESEGGPLRPLALHGIRRVESLPTVGGEFPDNFFDEGVRTVDYSDLQRGQRTALIIPLGTARPRPLLGIVLDRPAGEPFEPREVQAAVAAAQVSAPRLEVALLFESLRAMAVLEERQHLAHEMHDGVAQDLAALGFEIDLARSLARKDGMALTGDLDAIRDHVTAIISDLRLRISDLSMAVRPERSLGAVMAQTLQRFGSTHGIRTTFEADEDQLRMQPHLENAVFRLVLATLKDARNGGAEQVTLRLAIHGGHGRVEVSHDGRSALLDNPAAADDAVRRAIPLHIEPVEGGGVCVSSEVAPQATGEEVAMEAGLRGRS